MDFKINDDGYIDQNLLRWSLKRASLLVLYSPSQLEFTPLEFETYKLLEYETRQISLEFTPLEFETRG